MAVELNFCVDVVFETTTCNMVAIFFLPASNNIVSHCAFEPHNKIQSTPVHDTKHYEWARAPNSWLHQKLSRHDWDFNGGIVWSVLNSNILFEFEFYWVFELIRFFNQIWNVYSNSLIVESIIWIEFQFSTDLAIPNSSTIRCPNQ